MIQGLRKSQGSGCLKASVYRRKGHGTEKSARMLHITRKWVEMLRANRHCLGWPCISPVWERICFCFQRSETLLQGKPHINSHFCWISKPTGGGTQLPNSKLQFWQKYLREILYEPS